MARLLTRRLTIAGLLVVITVVLVACAGSASAPLPVTDGSGETRTGDSDSTQRQVGGAPEGPPVGDPASGPDTAASDPLAIGLRPLVVKTGSLELEVTDLDTALLRARTAVIGFGGYVSDSQRTNGTQGALASITYRIPADRWDEALDALAGLATKVLAEKTQAAEVTAQVVDLDARIGNLRATESALQAIMARASKISDILEVQNQLTTVRGQIEQLAAQRNHLADQATFGTLAVTWAVPLVAITEATEGWNLATELDRALAQLLQLGQGLLVLGVWFAVVVVPVVGGIALMLALAILVARRLGLVRRPASLPPSTGPSAA